MSGRLSHSASSTTGYDTTSTLPSPTFPRSPIPKASTGPRSPSTASTWSTSSRADLRGEYRPPGGEEESIMCRILDILHLKHGRLVAHAQFPRAVRLSGAAALKTTLYHRGYKLHWNGGSVPIISRSTSDSLKAKHGILLVPVQTPSERLAGSAGCRCACCAAASSRPPAAPGKGGKFWCSIEVRVRHAVQWLRGHSCYRATATEHRFCAGVLPTETPPLCACLLWPVGLPLCSSTRGGCPDDHGCRLAILPIDLCSSAVPCPAGQWLGILSYLARSYIDLA